MTNYEKFMCKSVDELAEYIYKNDNNFLDEVCRKNLPCPHGDDVEENNCINCVKVFLESETEELIGDGFDLGLIRLISQIKAVPEAKIVPDSIRIRALSNDPLAMVQPVRIDYLTLVPWGDDYSELLSEGEE